MKKNILILLLFIANSSFSQNMFNYHKDFETILRQSQDSTSVLYYPKLLERFNDNDDTLTNSDIIALLIGHTTEENYKPYKTLKTEREIHKLVKLEKFDQAIIKSDSLLKINPLNFSALMEKSYSYMKLEKPNSEFHKKKFMKIVYSIMSSGDGTIKNPYFVLNPSDGATLIKYILGGKIGITGSGDDSNGYFLDILEMISKKETKTLHFNINHAAEKMFTKEEKEKIKNGG
ncbi:DUF4919 domain-containing protein [Aquimarina sp. 2304DJ70-9]|uniref:DUF4919 domain-containing protein n=1 Tax=Aquimarina penaris TaxID=3231044 RepID=UPI003461FE71